MTPYKVLKIIIFSFIFEVIKFVGEKKRKNNEVTHIVGESYDWTVLRIV